MRIKSSIAHITEWIFHRIAQLHDATSPKCYQVG